MSVRETLERIEVMREMFPRCFYCGEAIDELRQVAVVAGRNRLAHQVCPPARTDHAAD